MPFFDVGHGKDALGKDALSYNHNREDSYTVRNEDFVPENLFEEEPVTSFELEEGSLDRPEESVGPEVMCHDASSLSGNAETADKVVDVSQSLTADYAEIVDDEPLAKSDLPGSEDCVAKPMVMSQSLTADHAEIVDDATSDLPGSEDGVAKPMVMSQSLTVENDTAVQLADSNLANSVAADDRAMCLSLAVDNQEMPTSKFVVAATWNSSSPGRMPLDAPPHAEDTGLETSPPTSAKGKESSGDTETVLTSYEGTQMSRTEPERSVGWRSLRGITRIFSLLPSKAGLLAIGVGVTAVIVFFAFGGYLK